MSQINQQSISLIHGTLAFPAFLPDATLGVVRGTDAADLRAAGVRALVMNVFHLMQKPGSSTISALGGQELIGDEDIERVREERRADLPGQPLTWRVALVQLVEQLTGRHATAAPAPVE